jgi:hypothetical protein
LRLERARGPLLPLFTEQPRRLVFSETHIPYMMGMF